MLPSLTLDMGLNPFVIPSPYSIATSGFVTIITSVILKIISIVLVLESRNGVINR